MTARILSMLLATIGLSCASVRPASMPEPRAVADYRRTLDELEVEGAALLASEGYEEAHRHLAMATTMWQRGQRETAALIVRRGQSIGAKAVRDARQSRLVLKAALDARARAIRAGADGLFGLLLSDADDALAGASRLVERGDLEGAKALRPDLVRRYAGLELRARRRSLVDRAVVAVALARKNGAARDAPRTFSRAAEQVERALRAANEDAGSEAAHAYAVSAVTWARRAAAISELLSMFEARRYTPEDVVLWHQQIIALLHEPIGERLPFDEPLSVVVRSFRKTLRSLLASVARSRDLVVAEQREVARLREALSRHALREPPAALDRFHFAESLFSRREARVTRSDDGITMQVHGFVFRPDHGGVVADNFGLLHRIASAVQRFPDARVHLIGHTDSSGSERRNRLLSLMRAQSVARFLTQVGGIAPERIRVQGVGSAVPIASNRTQAGRALNRRIEIRLRVDRRVTLR